MATKDRMDEEMEIKTMTPSRKRRNHLAFTNEFNNEIRKPKTDVERTENACQKRNYFE